MTHGTPYNEVMSEQHDDISATFVARLWDEQRRLGLSDAALARLVDVDHAHISRWKTGARSPRVTLNLADRIARRLPSLGVSIMVPSGTDNQRRITDATEEGSAA